MRAAIRRQNRQGGFTLLEILVAVTVLALLMVGLSQGVRTGFDGVDGPLTAPPCDAGGCRRSPKRGAILMTMTTIGLDLAKYVFQVHDVDAEGNVIEKRRLRRSQVIAYFASIPPCLV